MKTEWIEIIKLIFGFVSIVFIVGVPTAGAIAIWGKRGETLSNIKNSFNSLSEELKGLTVELKNIKEAHEQVMREVYPAMKNGGIITSEQLDRRITSTETNLTASIDALFRRVEQLDKKNSRDHNLSSNDIDIIINGLAKKIKEMQ